MSARPRIWITGIGMVTPIGIGRDPFRAGLRAGRSAVTRIDRFDPSTFRSQAYWAFGRSLHATESVRSATNSG